MTILSLPSTKRRRRKQKKNKGRGRQSMSMHLHPPPINHRTHPSTHPLIHSLIHSFAHPSIRLPTSPSIHNSDNVESLKFRTKKEFFGWNGRLGSSRLGLLTVSCLQTRFSLLVLPFFPPSLLPASCFHSSFTLSRCPKILHFRRHEIFWKS